MRIVWWCSFGNIAQLVVMLWPVLIYLSTCLARRPQVGSYPDRGRRVHEMRLTVHDTHDRSILVIGPNGQMLAAWLWRIEFANRGWIAHFVRPSGGELVAGATFKVISVRNMWSTAETMKVGLESCDWHANVRRPMKSSARWARRGGEYGLCVGGFCRIHFGNDFKVLNIIFAINL